MIKYLHKTTVVWVNRIIVNLPSKCPLKQPLLCMRGENMAKNHPELRKCCQIAKNFVTTTSGKV